MKIRLFLLLITGYPQLAPSLLAAPPVVSNVTASQRPGTKFVDITYDLADSDGDAQLVQVQVSGDGGATYTIPCVSLTGNVGAGVTPGSNRKIVWNAGADWNGQFVQSTKVRVTANDGSTPPPPPGMVLVPAGTFQMGDNFTEGASDELPVHNVYVDGIFIDKFEVSRESWLPVATWAVANGYDFSNNTGPSSKGAGHPMYYIHWYDAVKWCNAKSEKENLIPAYYTNDLQTSVYRLGEQDIDNLKVKWNATGYRLPTEAEWEKAARGGTLGLRYPWGNTIGGSQANYGNSGDAFETGNDPKTTPVGYYSGAQIPSGSDMANGYGIYDIVGNMREWCWDVYNEGAYASANAGNNPHGPSNLVAGGPRVVRGGSWGSAVADLRLSRRVSISATNVFFNVLHHQGFRCVRKAQ